MMVWNARMPEQTTPKKSYIEKKSTNSKSIIKTSPIGVRKKFVWRKFRMIVAIVVKMLKNILVRFVIRFFPIQT